MTDHHHKIIKGLMISLLLIIADINFPFLSPVPSQTNKPQASSSNVNEEADYQSSMMSEAYDLKSIGCNTKAISHTLNNPTPNGFVNFNGVNLPNILHTSTFVFDASQGNTICITYQNGTENAGSKEYNYLMNTVDVIKVGPSLVKYVTTASYTAAVNININTQCSCNCDYFEMYDYLNCEVDECVKVASQTRNGCGFAKVGWPSCLINFDTYETAKFYTISPPVYAYVPFDEYILYEAPMNLSYINPNTNCNLKYTSGSMNFTKGNSPNMYNTFPINAQYSYTKVTPNQFPISNPPMTGSFVSNAPLYPDLTNPCLQEALARIPYSKNVNIRPLGQFNLITYPGNEILAFYKNEWYKPADVNGVNEFNPRLCGWLKLNGKTNLFDKVQASKSATLKTYDCGEKTMELNYDITSCNTSNWIKLDSYMAEWGIMSTENALNGEFSLKTRNQAGTLLEVTTDFPASIINYVYGIFSFSCSSIRGFQSSTILCNMTYQVGDQKTHFVIRDKNEVVVYENDVILDGTGKEEVTIIIPHQIYKTFSYICFPDVKTKTKCANITLDAYGFNTTNPNWISFINSSDADDTSNSINVELPSFNFFDPSTWEHNLTKTIFTWIGIFLICCLLIIIIATIIYCSPQIYIMYEQTKLRLNRYRKKEVNFSPLISEESEL